MIFDRNSIAFKFFEHNNVNKKENILNSKEYFRKFHVMAVSAKGP